MTDKLEKPRRRPLGVWVIFVYYMLSSGFMLLLFVLTFSGIVALPAEHESYMDSLSAVDWFVSFAIGGLHIIAVVCLFLLRRVAVMFFLAALVLNVVSTLIYILQTDWLEAVGAAGLPGMFLGWLIMIVVILYARTLAKKGVLY